MDKKRLFLVTLLDLESWQCQQIWVDTLSADGMQVWIDQCVADGDLNPPLEIRNPTVVRVEEKLCYLVPVTNPAC